jgi:hypothetical protein
MKLFSLSALVFASLALVACDSKSDKSSDQEGEADAAVNAETSETCEAHADGTGLHGDMSAFTKADGGQFHVKIEWSSPLKASSLENKATLTFVNDHAHALPIKLTSFKLFMPAMGHGSSRADQMVMTQNAEAANIWSVDQIYFSMGGGAGEWVVDLEAGGCGVSDKARVVIPVEVQ